MVSSLSSNFVKEDISLLIQAIDDWETNGTHEYAMAMAVKNSPLPPEDNEFYDFIASLKKQFSQRELELARLKEEKQEKAVMLKAKLFLARKEIEINEVFDFASQTSESPQGEFDSSAKKLALAEKFIDEVGIRKHYEEFLAGKK
jgi:hypothetical protein